MDGVAGEIREVPLSGHWGERPTGAGADLQAKLFDPPNKLPCAPVSFFRPNRAETGRAYKNRKSPSVDFAK
jgi:hypothetical protein